MPAKHKPFVVYLDDVAAQHMDRIRAYYEKKNEGSAVKVNDGYIGRELIRQKYVDIQNETTQSLTLKKAYEEILEIGKKLDFFVGELRPKTGLVKLQKDVELILELLEAKRQ